MLGAQVNPILNKSYARLVSQRFSEAAQTLRDKLVDMGFEESEAEANIEAEQPELADGLFGRQIRPKPNVVIELDINEAEAKEIAGVAPRKITVAPSAEGKASIKIEGILKPAEKDKLYAQAPAHIHGQLREKITKFEAEHAHEVAPAHSLGEIEYWTRNVAKHQNSFYLPTPTGRFFPDFVAKLKDGRILVVEYKGQQHAGEQETKDTRQKALIGEQWARNSNGQGVFVLATMERNDPNEIRNAILAAISN